MEMVKIRRTDSLVNVKQVLPGMDDWCTETFGEWDDVDESTHTWTWFGGTLINRTFQFRYEKDAALFLLKWGAGDGSVKSV